MAGQFVLEWPGNASAAAVVMNREPVRSTDELDGLIDQLERIADQAAPFIAELVAPNGASLGIGLGRPETVLAFKASPTGPPYYLSRNSECIGSKDTGQVDASISYSYQGEFTEFSRESCLAPADGRAALREFFVKQGALPTVIEWDEI